MSAVTWAQRSSESDPERNYVFLTIVAADVPESDLKLDLQPTKLSFKGTSTSKKVTYAVDLEFFAEIDPKESKIQHSGRDVTLVLRKKELKEEFWPRLLKDKAKVHFLKTNFDKVSKFQKQQTPNPVCLEEYAALTAHSGSTRTSRTRLPQMKR